MSRHFWAVLLLVIFVAGCTREIQPPVLAPPVADFDASPVQGSSPLEVIFTNASSGEISAFHWDFGDRQFSSDPEPSHTYSKAGDYDVTLAVMGPGGSDAETKTEYIRVTTGVVNWEESASYIGQHVVVEGKVVNSYYAADTESRLTYLDFHKPYKNYFKCIIWGSDRDKFIKQFQQNPENYFLNKKVQVTGLIKEYPERSGIPEMVLSEPSQIKLIEE